MSSSSRATSSAPTLSVHDPEFKNLITVPLSAVHHLPPAHLEISRLVLCRKYDPRDSVNSCSMGDSCKFVHIDMSTPELSVQSIHVNYAYRSLEEVQHETLPAGEMLNVMAPNNRAPSQLVPSELVIVTKGAQSRHTSRGPLSHCAHYFYNRMCNRGHRCGFLHCIYIDPTASEFQRAPPRAGAGLANAAGKGSTSTQQPVQPARQPVAATFQPQQPQGHVAAPLVHHVPNNAHAVASAPTAVTPIGKSLSSSSHTGSSCDLSSCESPRSHHSSGEYELSHTTSSNGHSHSQNQRPMTFSPSPSTSSMGKVAYRRNPYSLLEVTTVVAE